jgi:hypothetical protein
MSKENTMTESEISDQFDFIDGTQKAQMLVLKSLLAQMPDAKAVLQRYASTLQDQSFF